MTTTTDVHALLRQAQETIHQSTMALERQERERARALAILGGSQNIVGLPASTTTVSQAVLEVVHSNPERAFDAKTIVDYILQTNVAIAEMYTSDATGELDRKRLDTSVRQALSRGVEREDIVKVATGRYQAPVAVAS